MNPCHPQIIFDPSYEGHHYYYINLLLRGDCDGCLFYIHPELVSRINVPFDKRKNVYSIRNEDIGLREIPTHNKKVNLIQRCYYNYKLWVGLKKLSKISGIRHILFIELDSFLLYLLFVFNRKYSISGILYKPYDFRNKLTIKESIKKLFLHILLLKSNVKTVFVLDEFFLNFRNTKERKKVKYLPDPSPLYPVVPDDRVLQIFTKKKYSLLFFGYIEERKGIFQALDALKHLPGEMGPVRFIFAGRIDPDISERIQLKVKEVEPVIEFVFLDKFLTEPEVAAMFLYSDLILAPYQNHVGSSGIINIAARYHKPIITQNTNLIGDLIVKYELGTGVNTLNPHDISNAIVQAMQQTPDQVKLDEYLRIHSEENFIHTIYDC